MKKFLFLTFISSIFIFLGCANQIQNSQIQIPCSDLLFSGAVPTDDTSVYDIELQITGDYSTTITKEGTLSQLNNSTILVEDIPQRSKIQAYILIKKDGINYFESEKIPYEMKVGSNKLNITLKKCSSDISVGINTEENLIESSSDDSLTFTLADSTGKQIVGTNYHKIEWKLNNSIISDKSESSFVINKKESQYVRIGTNYLIVTLYSAKDTFVKSYSATFELNQE